MTGIEVLLMCGIAGFCRWDGDFTRDREGWSQVLVRMRRSLAHRGHDQTGEYLDRWVGLAHTRLSIRDLAGGGQPMVRQRAGKDFAIVYNGEIYNTGELAPELEKLGYRFETTCDTEVILYAYMAWGLDFAEKLNGIYALAVWDGAEGRLVLCRDRLGVKPLFYTVKGDALVFGSEPKALFCHPQVRPEADGDSFREIFGVGPARTPGVGVFRGVGEVRPGHLAVFDREGLREYTYWSLEARPHRDSYPETVERVSFLLWDAVERQMVSDVPVCSFLSGGVDSSVVTALASNFLGREGGELNTFSFDFAHNDRYFHANSFQPTRDRPYVDRMLDLYPLRHTYLECDEDTLVDLLPQAVFYKDLPGMADVDTSLMYFCGRVKEHNKVALTGECADEIFGGYPWSYREDLFYAGGFPWSHDLAARTALLSDQAVEELELGDYVRARYAEALKAVPALPEEKGDDLRRRQVSCLNIRWFMQTLLDRMDRASMSCGLEARVPFADHRLVEYLYNVPWEMKFQNGVEKALLRDACKDLLPPELLYRKKSPYPKTYSPRYEALLQQQFRCLLADKSAPIHRFLDRGKAERARSATQDNGRPWFGQLMAGPQMLAYLLQVNDWMERYQVG